MRKTSIEENYRFSLDATDKFSISSDFEFDFKSTIGGFAGTKRDDDPEEIKFHALPAASLSLVIIRTGLEVASRQIIVTVMFLAYLCVRFKNTSESFSSLDICHTREKIN